MHFKIIVPMFNVENWVETTIKSVLAQKYRDYQCIIIDDISTDDSYNLVKDLIKNDERFLLIKNNEKKFALQNIVEAIQLSQPKDEDVIVTLDGDDWFVNDGVLEKLKLTYEKNNCWLTYGNHINYPDGLPYWSLFPYPQEIIADNSYRSFRFLASHLRTFKYKLWKNIDINDLKDNNNQYFKMGWDLAMMFPMLEMSREKAYFIDEYLYVYNNQNPLNDYKLDHKLQFSTEILLRSRKKYNKLEIL